MTTSTSSSSSTRKIRVSWTDREKNIIAEQVYRTNPNILSTKISLCSACNDAQVVLVAKGMLDKTRVRKVKASGHVDWMAQAIRKIDADANSDKLAKEQEAHEAEEKRLEEERKQYMLEHVSELPTADLLRVLINRFADVFDAHLLPIAIPLIERLAPTLSPFIEGIVVNSLASHLNKAAPSYSPVGQPVSSFEPVPSVTPTRDVPVRKPRIIIIGLRGEQPAQIKKSFEASFDITFYGSDVPAKQLKSALRFTDCVFYMTKFNSHATQKTLQDSGVKFEFLTGGITKLRTQLSALLDGWN